jgi:hypothetical protein
VIDPVTRRSEDTARRVSFDVDSLVTVRGCSLVTVWGFGEFSDSGPAFAVVAGHRPGTEFGGAGLSDVVAVVAHRDHSGRIFDVWDRLPATSCGLVMVCTPGHRLGS